MKKDIAQLRTLMEGHGLAVNDDGAVQVKPPTPPKIEIPVPKNDDLIAAIHSLETAVKGDAKQDGALLAEVRALRAAIEKKRTWVFEVDKDMDGIRSITARSQ